MRKRLLLIGMCVVMAFSTVACKKKDSKKDNTETTSASEQETTVPGSNPKDSVAEGDAKVTELAEYKGLEVYKSKVTIADTSVDSSVNSILSQYPVKEGKVTDKSIVNIDYVGKLDGEAFKGGTAQGQTLDIANSTYIKGFAEGLVGVKIGDTVDLNLTFPDPYDNNPDLAGKAVVFTVTVNSVMPELTDEFVAANLKKQYEVSTVKELKDYVKNQMILSAKYSAVWSDYVSSCVVEVSKEELDKLIQNGVEYYENFVKSQTDKELKEYIEENGQTYEEFEETLKLEAMSNLKEQMIAEEIAKKENIEVTDEEYEKEANYYIETYSLKDKAEFEEKYNKDDIMKNILYYKVVEWVCNNTNVVDDPETTSAEATSEETSSAE